MNARTLDTQRTRTLDAIGRTHVRPVVIPVRRTPNGWVAIPNGRKRSIAPID